MTQEELLAELMIRLARVEIALVRRMTRNERRRAKAAKERAEMIAARKVQTPGKITMPERDWELYQTAAALVAFQEKGAYMTSRVVRAAIECASDTRWARIAGALQADPAIGYHPGKGWYRNV
jgi:hypothetical protein